MCRGKRGKEKRKRRLKGALLALAGTGVFSVCMVMAAFAAPKSREAERQAAETQRSAQASAEVATEVTAEENEKETAQKADGMPCVSAAPDGAQAGPKEPEIPLIAVDAGHGGTDEGCFYGGVLEKDINLGIAQLVKQKLENLGYRVLMIRDDDSYMAKEERVKLANLRGADAYVSIHQNIYEDVSASGVEVWYDGTDEERESARLAKLVQKYVRKKTEARQRQLRDDADFYVTGKTGMPSCLIETGFLSNEAERSLLVTGEYQEKLAAGIAEGVDLFFRPKTMYLTFDDGPSAKNTDMVLDILKERNIKATFFVVGENVRRYPEVAARIVQEGHTIGIHCYSHDYNKIYESVDSYLEDFEEAYREVLAATGTEAKLFRFPGGSVNAYNEKVREEIAEEMTARGFLYYDWNASLEDAVKKSTPQQLIENAVSTTLGRKRVVMLAHDVVDNTALCLNELLDQFPEYQMKPLSEETEPIQFPMK